MFPLDSEITTSVSPSPHAAEAGAVVDALLRFASPKTGYDAGARELFESAFTQDAVLDFRPAARTCGIEVPLIEGRDMITSIIMSPETRIDTSHVVTNTQEER